MDLIYLLGIVVYMAVMGIALAFWEVQIEGKHGWAEKLPCWRKTDGLIVKTLLANHRPLTSYHIGMWIYLFLSLHLILFFTPWNFLTEIFIMGLFFELTVIEDFFWFVLNPFYGLKKFNKNNKDIWWYKEEEWLGPVLWWYILYVVIAAIFISFGSAGIT